MNKTEVKDDFIQYVAPMLDEPVTQEAIDEAFKAYIQEMFDGGEITWVQFTTWKHDGSGLTPEFIAKRAQDWDGGRYKLEHKREWMRNWLANKRRRSLA
jgi:hypothetical protein